MWTPPIASRRRSISRFTADDLREQSTSPAGSLSRDALPYMHREAAYTERGVTEPEAALCIALVGMQLAGAGNCSE